MDKDNLDLESLLTRLNAEQFISPKKDAPQKDVPQKEALQKLLIALFFMAVGVILVATGFISLLLRLLGLMHFPIAWLKQRIKRESARRMQQIRQS